MKKSKDPTGNVRKLLIFHSERSDALRQAEQTRVDGLMEAERRRIDDRTKLQSDYDEKLRIAEGKRIDAIRAVDVNAVSVANERATAQASVLANQVSSSAETLRSLVAATAATQAQQLSSLTSQITDRLASLEKSQYENKGTSGGARDMYGWLAGGLMMVMTIGNIIFSIFHH